MVTAWIWAMQIVSTDHIHLKRLFVTGTTLEDPGELLDGARRTIPSVAMRWRVMMVTIFEDNASCRSTS